MVPPAGPRQPMMGGAPVVPPVAPAAQSVAPVVPPPPPAAARAAGPATPPPPPSAAVRGTLDANQIAELEARCAKLEQLDYFEVLQLPRDATPADIKKAFYRESRTYHPDRFYQLDSKALKDQVNELYKRVTEAYYVLRDDSKRRKYLGDISSPERAQKLRFTEASEAESKAAVKKEHEEQIGTTPKGRHFYQLGTADLEAGRWSSAERNLKTALMYESSNARYKEKLVEAQKKLNEESKAKGEAFKIK